MNFTCVDEFNYISRRRFTVTWQEDTYEFVNRNNEGWEFRKVSPKSRVDKVPEETIKDISKNDFMELIGG